MVQHNMPHEARAHETRAFDKAPRGSGNAVMWVAGILAVTVIVFFSARLFWHEERQEADPASISAPDSGAQVGTRGTGEAPLDPTAN